MTQSLTRVTWSFRNDLGEEPCAFKAPRITFLVGGILAAIGGAVILWCPGLNVGSVSGYILFSGGIVVTLIAIAIKCVKFKLPVVNNQASEGTEIKPASSRWQLPAWLIKILPSNLPIVQAADIPAASSRDSMFFCQQSEAKAQGIEQ